MRLKIVIVVRRNEGDLDSVSLYNNVCNIIDNRVLIQSDYDLNED
jgi:hypothetical protein